MPEIHRRIILRKLAEIPEDLLQLKNKCLLKSNTFLKSKRLMSRLESKKTKLPKPLS